MKGLFHRVKERRHGDNEDTAADMGTRPGDVPHTDLQPGLDQTLEGVPRQQGAQHDKHTDKQTATVTGPIPRVQLLPKEPALQDPVIISRDVKADIATPTLGSKPQEIIAPLRTNLPGQVDHPKSAGYSPLKESAPVDTSTNPVHSPGLASVKPPITDIGTTTPSDLIGKPPRAGVTKDKDQMEPLIKKSFPDDMDAIKPKDPLIDKVGATRLGDRKVGESKPGDSKKTGHSMVGESKSGDSKKTGVSNFGGSDIGGPKPGGGPAGTTSGGKGDTSSTSTRSDFTNALDKITTDDDETSSKAQGESMGVTAAAAEYVSAGAKALAEKACQVKEATAPEGTDTDSSFVDSAKGTAQAAGEKAKAAGRSVTDAAAQGLGAAQEALDTKGKSASDKSMTGAQTTGSGASEDTKSVIEKAQDALQNAAAVVSDKTSQAYQAAQQKLQDSGLPQKLAEHHAAAQDIASNKLNEFSTEAQAHANVAQDLANRKIEEGRHHAQEAARIGKEKAAELASNVQNMSAEDVNRSTVGRSLGGILLLWLASYALGIPFKISAALALLAISGVLFADWDRRRHMRARYGDTIFSAVRPPKTRVTHARSYEEQMHTSFGPVKLHAGRVEEGPSGTKFIPHSGEQHLMKEE